MDISGSSRFRHMSTPTTDRLLGAFPHASINNTISTSEDENELNEDDIFSAGDFSSDPPNDNHHHYNDNSPTSSAPSTPRHHHSHFHKPAFHQSESFGILAALPDHKTTANSHHHLFQKATVSSSSSTSSSSSSSSSSLSSASRPIPSIPKPPQERVPPLSMSFSKYHHQHQSAPVNVPVLSMAMRKNRKFEEIDEEEEEEGEGEMLPPHEIVARAHSPMVPCSVLEGAGRTLKGRDLRQVRNAVWRRTGFLD